jgi:hypothetical protein
MIWLATRLPTPGNPDRANSSPSIDGGGDPRPIGSASALIAARTPIPLTVMNREKKARVLGMQEADDSRDQVPAGAAALVVLEGVQGHLAPWQAVSSPTARSRIPDLVRQAITFEHGQAFMNFRQRLPLMRTIIAISHRRGDITWSAVVADPRLPCRLLQNSYRRSKR